MIRHDTLLQWIDEVRALCQPDRVRWCDGSQAEYDELCELLVQNGTFRRLNPDRRPGSFLAWSDPNDVARVEDRTFICSDHQADAGPTNNWRAPDEMRAELTKLYTGAMKETLKKPRSNQARPSRSRSAGSRKAHSTLPPTSALWKPRLRACASS